MSKEYLTVEEIATTLRVERRAVIRLIDTGKLPATKPAKAYLIDRADLDRLLDESQVRRSA